MSIQEAYTVDVAALAARYGITRRHDVGGREGYRIPCPAHRGQDPNCAIWRGDHGQLLAHCHSHGCAADDIRRALGVEYAYEGRQYRRTDGSTYTRRRGPGKDYSGNAGSPRGQLLTLTSPTPAPDAVIVIVEGEKSADDAAAMLADDGYAVGHWTGGAGAVDGVDWTPAVDHRVILLPDADEPGVQAMRKAGAALAALGVDVRIADVHAIGAPEGADPSTYTRAELLTLLRGAATGAPDAIEELPAASQAAYHYGRTRLQGQAIYTPGGPVWVYDAPTWRTAHTGELWERIRRDYRTLRLELLRLGLADAAAALERAYRGGHRDGVEGGLRAALEGTEPRPAAGLIAVANGVVRLSDGALLPHAPEYGTRSTTTAGYYPMRAAEYEARLERKCAGVYASPGALDCLLDVMALMLLRRAHEYSRTMLWLHGPSRSGKGRTIDWMRAALGPAAVAVGPDYWDGRHGEIDVPTADWIERRPVLIASGEVGADTRIAWSRLLSVTGGEEQSARRPHGALLRGIYDGIVALSAVRPPRGRRASGITGRAIAIATAGRLPDGHPMRTHDGDDGDALLTLSAMRAIEAWAAMAAGTYRAPDSPDTRALLGDIDPWAAWIDGWPDDWDGRTLKAIATDGRTLQDDGGLSLERDSRDITAHRVGRRVRDYARDGGRWTTRRIGSGPMGVALRPRPLPDDAPDPPPDGGDGPATPTDGADAPSVEGGLTPAVDASPIPDPQTALYAPRSAGVGADGGAAVGVERPRPRPDYGALETCVRCGSPYAWRLPSGKPGRHRDARHPDASPPVYCYSAGA